MNEHLSLSAREKLSALDGEIRKRASLAIFGYALGMTGAVGLYLWFPFSLSRVGSVVLVIALAQMIWKMYAASRHAFHIGTAMAGEELLGCLGKVDAQLMLMQSLIYNLPFLVGANLFFMGLPGTGSAESKAWLDCFFLLGTVLLFSGFYVINQRAVRRQLLPLRRELARCVTRESGR